MSIHPNIDPTPLTASRRRRRTSDLAIASSLLAVAVILGIGITAFSILPSHEVMQATTTGQVIPKPSPMQPNKIYYR
jgi:hypothetical protein